MKRPKNGNEDARRMVALKQRESELPRAIEVVKSAKKKLDGAKALRLTVKTDEGKTKKVKDKAAIQMAKQGVDHAKARRDRIQHEIKVLKSRLGAKVMV